MKEELSATEQARQRARRATQLEQHMLQGRPAPAPAPASTPRGPREPRDPLELQRGLDVEVLDDSASDRLFPGTGG